MTTENTLDSPLSIEELAESFKAACQAAATWWAIEVLRETMRGLGRENHVSFDVNAFIAALQQELLEAAQARGYLESFVRFSKHPRGFRIALKFGSDPDADEILCRAGTKVGLNFETGPGWIYLSPYRMSVTPYHVWVDRTPERLVWHARGKEKMFYRVPAVPEQPQAIEADE